MVDEDPAYLFPRLADPRAVVDEHRGLARRRHLARTLRLVPAEARDHRYVRAELARAPRALLRFGPASHRQTRENRRAELADRVPQLVPVGHPVELLVEARRPRELGPHAARGEFRRVRPGYPLHALVEVDEHAVQVNEEFVHRFRSYSRRPPRDKERRPAPTPGPPRGTASRLSKHRCETVGMFNRRLLWYPRTE